MSMYQSTTADRNSRSAGSRKNQIKVWDIAVRLFHWTLVLSFAFAWLTADDWTNAHEIAGYTIAVLLGFRLIWGFIGGKYARFSDFVTSPFTVISYIQQEMAGKAKRYIGHNPAGGAMVIALLLSLIVITLTGIAMTTDAFWGLEWVEDAHEAVAILALLLVGAHVVGVIFASRQHRENLVKSMITGWKRRK